MPVDPDEPPFAITVADMIVFAIIAVLFANLIQSCAGSR